MTEVNGNDDDVIMLGKLRRPKRNAAAVSYDPGYGIRVIGESTPPDADQAARWIRAAGGWMRWKKNIPKGHPEVDHFIKQVRRR